MSLLDFDIDFAVGRRIVHGAELAQQLHGRGLREHGPSELRVFREAFLFLAVAIALVVRPQGLIPARGLKERI